MATDGIRVVIPIRKYLKEYISTYVPVNPHYRLSMQDSIGQIILALLQKPTYKNEPKEPDYDDSLVVVVPRGYFVLQRMEMTNKCVFAFNLIIDEMMRMHFRQHMNSCALFGIEHKIAIINFCELYNITLDDSIEYETLKKDYYRHRQRTEEIRPKFLPVNKNTFLSLQKT